MTPVFPFGITNSLANGNAEADTIVVAGKVTGLTLRGGKVDCLESQKDVIPSSTVISATTRFSSTVQTIVEGTLGDGGSDDDTSHLAIPLKR